MIAGAHVGRGGAAVGEAADACKEEVARSMRYCNTTEEGKIASSLKRRFFDKAVARSASHQLIRALYQTPAVHKTQQNKGVNSVHSC